VILVTHPVLTLEFVVFVVFFPNGDGEIDIVALRICATSLVLCIDYWEEGEAS
jgi:hypothetical protein